MRYRLRTLLILLAVGPPVLAAGIYVGMMLVGAGAPGYELDDLPLRHSGGRPAPVEHPYPELTTEPTP